MPDRPRDGDTPIPPGAEAGASLRGPFLDTGLLRNVRRGAVGLGGGALLLAGTALLVLPGPGIPLGTAMVFGSLAVRDITG